PEHGTTAAVVRRGARALAGAAGALLAVRLLAAAADLAARLGVVGADPPAGELGRDDLVQDRLVHRRAEEPVVQLDAADVGPGAVEEGCRRHRSGLPDHDQAAPGARQAALDQQEVLAGVGADDADLLGRDLLVAHVAGHAHALVDATWGRARADRAGLAMVVGAVGRGTAVEVVALHVAREALALRDAGDVHEVALGEDVGDGQGLPDLVGRHVVDAELAQRAQARQVAELSRARLRQL